MREEGHAAALPPGSPARLVSEILEDARTRLDSAYRSAVADLPPDVRKVGGYHIGWWDADGGPLGAVGKGLRPALVFASAGAVAGPSALAVRQDAVLDAAVAVELVHDFSLLHDDVMDADMLRRHRPAAWVVYGTGAAILTGDMFLTRAIEMLILRDVGSALVLTAALAALCRGQSADLAFEQRAIVDIASCLAMAEGKTGALLGAACELGARAAGSTAERARTLNHFGRKLGVAFQLVDDLLGIRGDPAVTGKPVHSDLARRKKSLPVVVAMNSETVPGRELARRYAAGDTFDDSELPELALLIEQAGGLRWAEHRSIQLCAEARQLLRSAGIETAAATDLLLLVDLINNRDR